MSLDPHSSQKSDARRLFLSRRDSVDPIDRDRWSSAIAALLAHRLLLPATGVLLVYLPMHSEVDLTAWVTGMLQAGQALALPRTVWRTRELVPTLLRSLDEVVIGRHGVPDVRDDCFRPVPLDAVSAALVPGVAFDRRGYRLGYGGGFYDRLLPRLRPECQTVGVAFALQVVDALAAEPHDQRVQSLVTEQGWQETRP